MPGPALWLVGAGLCVGALWASVQVVNWNGGASVCIQVASDAGICSAPPALHWLGAAVAVAGAMAAVWLVVTAIVRLAASSPALGGWVVLPLFVASLAAIGMATLITAFAASVAGLVGATTPSPLMAVPAVLVGVAEIALVAWLRRDPLHRPRRLAFALLGGYAVAVVGFTVGAAFSLIGAEFVARANPYPHAVVLRAAAGWDLLAAVAGAGGLAVAASVLGEGRLPRAVPRTWQPWIALAAVAICAVAGFLVVDGSLPGPGSPVTT